MDFLESDEHRDLRAAVGDRSPPGSARTTTSSTPAPARPCDELWTALGDAGFIGVNVPEEYGGGGGGLVELAIVCEEIAAQGTPLLLLLVSAAISAEVIADFGSDGAAASAGCPASPTARRRWSSRSPSRTPAPTPTSSSTTATRDGDELGARGTKYYISGVDEAEALLRRGAHRQGRARARRSCRCSSCPPTPPGCTRPTAARRRDAAGEAVHACTSTTCGCPPSALVGEEGAGFKQVFRGLNPERITGAALCVRHRALRAGAGRRVRQRPRRCGTRPIGAHQGVAHPLAKAKIETELAALMTRKAAWLHDRGLPAGEASNMAKYAAAEAALAAVDAAMQTHGGNGLATEYGLLPYWGLARLLRIAPVNREMILNYVAQHGLGLPRSYSEELLMSQNLIQRVNVGDSLTRTAAARPDQRAVVDGDRALDLRRAQRLGQPARARPGRARATPAATRSALASGNSAEFLAVYYACAKLGVVCVPINLGWRADEVAYVLGHSGARGIVVETQLVAAIREALRRPTDRRRDRRPRHARAVRVRRELDDAGRPRPPTRSERARRVRRGPRPDHLPLHLGHHVVPQGRGRRATWRSTWSRCRRRWTRAGTPPTASWR